MVVRGEGTQHEFVGRKDEIYNIMDAPFSISTTIEVKVRRDKQQKEQ